MGAMDVDFDDNYAEKKDFPSGEGIFFPILIPVLAFLWGMLTALALHGC